MGIYLYNIKESSICGDMLHSILNEVPYIYNITDSNGTKTIILLLIWEENTVIDETN